MSGRSRGSPSKALGWRLLLALAAGLGALGIAEASLRVYHSLKGTYELSARARQARERSWCVGSTDPQLIYTNRPGYEVNGARLINAQGMLRLSDASLEKPPGTLRVALVGDSIAAGLNLAYERRFGSLLEAALAADESIEADAVEVLNFAVSGYRSTQEARLVETVVVEFAPDLVVLQYCMNDAGSSYTPTIWFQDLTPPRSHLVEAVARALGRSGDPRQSEFVPVYGPGYGQVDYWFDLYGPESASWRSVVDSFARIQAAVAGRGTPVLLVIFPFLLDDTYPADIARPFHDQVRAAGAALGWEVLDLTETFAGHDPASLQVAADDIYHPNALGHALAAESIHQRITLMLQ